jgi:hypothetical protein
MRLSVTATRRQQQPTQEPTLNALITTLGKWIENYAMGLRNGFMEEKTEREVWHVGFYEEKKRGIEKNLG